MHFVAIGAAIFGVYAWRGVPEAAPAPSFAAAPSRQVEVTAAKLAELAQRFQEIENRSPSSAELTNAANQWAREEILYREGQLAGFDRNDPVIRQRLVKLMEWYIAGAAAGGEPSDEELRRHYAENRERYRQQRLLSFEQIFFSRERRGATGETDAQMVAKSLRSGKQTALEVALGHGDSLGSDKASEVLQRSSPEELIAKFGRPLIDTIQALRANEWGGPFPSPGGWHVVRRLAPQTTNFEDLRWQVREEIIAARGPASPDNAYAELLRRYDVKIDDLPPEVRK